jgi:hypothetical protein
MTKKKPKPSDIRIPPDRADEEVDDSVLSAILQSDIPPESKPQKGKPKRKSKV